MSFTGYICIFSFKLESMINEEGAALYTKLNTRYFEMRDLGSTNFHSFLIS
jgi:hypothetical protein